MNATPWKMTKARALPLRILRNGQHGSEKLQKPRSHLPICMSVEETNEWVIWPNRLHPDIGNQFGKIVKAHHKTLETSKG